MTKLAPEAMGSPGTREATGKKWLAEVSKRCPGVKWTSHFALLGRWDFMDIYEAPDVETAHKVSYISRTQGAVDAESWQAIPYDRFLKIAEEVAKG
jgi:uncharacterized protein with GYD domain